MMYLKKIKFVGNCSRPIDSNPKKHHLFLIDNPQLRYPHRMIARGFWAESIPARNGWFLALTWAPRKENCCSTYGQLYPVLSRISHVSRRCHRKNLVVSRCETGVYLQSGRSLCDGLMSCRRYNYASHAWYQTRYLRCFRDGSLLYRVYAPI